VYSNHNTHTKCHDNQSTGTKVEMLWADPAHHYGTYKSQRGCLALQIHASTGVPLSDHRTVKRTMLRCPPIHNIHPKCNGINQLVQKWICLKYVLTHAHTHMIISTVHFSCPYTGRSIGTMSQKKTLQFNLWSLNFTQL